MATSWAKVLNASDYYAKFINKSVRPDGRHISQVRKTCIKFGGITSTYGSGSAKIGNTNVVAGITAEVGQPIEIDAAAGDIDVHVHLTPVCSPDFSVGKAPEQAVALGSFIKRVVLSTGMISLHDLCIEEGKSAWQLQIDLICLDYDGNLADVAFLALAAALRTVRLPNPSVSEDGIVTISPDLVTPLAIEHIPIPLSFGVFQLGGPHEAKESRIITDPTSAEESVLDGSFTIVLGNDGELLTVQKYGGSELTVQDLRICMRHCKRRAVEIRQQFKTLFAEAV